MTDEATSAPSSLSLPSLNSKDAVKELNANDILLGRGPGLSKYVGNIRFRALVEERKDEYVAACKRKDKKRIAKEIVDLVHSKGGRFLKQEDAVDYNDVWYEVDEAAAMEKAKQSLREQRHQPPASITPDVSSPVGRGGESVWPGSTSCESSGLIGSIPEAPLSQEQVLGMETAWNHPAESFSGESSSTTSAGASQNGPENFTSFARSPLVASFASSAAPTSHKSTLSSQPTPAVPVTNWFYPVQATSVQATSCAPHMPTSVDPRLLLFRGTPFNNNQQSMILQSMLIDQVLRSQLLSSLQNTADSNSLSTEERARQRILQELLQSATVTAATSHQRLMAENAMYSLLRNFAVGQASHSQFDNVPTPEATSVATNKMTSGPSDDNVMEIDVEEESQHTSAVGDSSSSEVSRASSSPPDRRPSDQSIDGSIDNELSAFLLSSLAVTDRPAITEEQEAMERDTLSDKEKAAVLSDLFGRMREQDAVPAQRKRARIDLDRTSIDFLIRQMKVELGNIPPNKKLALMEAQMNARAEEFSDSRLEKFLRCEGMNTKLAAERFVRYWESRREVFGPEKYTMRMTLSGALRDDLAALSIGLPTLLPHPDLSGRQILFMELRRHAREGYSSESLLRAIWYVAEVAAQENTDVDGGVVNLNWLKGTTLLDYDAKVLDRWAYLLSSCWPIKLFANHLCCPASIFIRIIRPIVHSFANKEFRSRSLEHDVADDNIVPILSNYGITREMLPTEMGGLVVLDQQEWIANRRAAELEEIN